MQAGIKWLWDLVSNTTKLQSRDPLQQPKVVMSLAEELAIRERQCRREAHARGRGKSREEAERA